MKTITLTRSEVMDGKLITTTRLVAAELAVFNIKNCHGANVRLHDYPTYTQYIVPANSEHNEIEFLVGKYE